MKPRFLAILFLGVALTGCSQHWREADPGVEVEDMEALLQESLQTVNAQSSVIPAGDAQRFQRLLDDPNTTIFFSETNPEMGDTVNVFPFVDWRFMGEQASAQNGGEIFSEHISYGRVFFLDLSSEDGSNENAILFDLEISGKRVVKIFFNDSQTSEVERTYFDSGEFVSHMVASDGSQVVLRSFDVDEDVLQSVIQLEFYDFVENGEENFTGKISTLVGFGT